jgi:hypothetical protein
VRSPVDLCPPGGPIPRPALPRVTRRKRLRRIRPVSGSAGIGTQVRVFGGLDPVTGKEGMLTGSAEDEDAAIKLRDTFRWQVAEPEVSHDPQLGMIA